MVKITAISNRTMRGQECVRPLASGNAVVGDSIDTWKLPPCLLVLYNKTSIKLDALS